MENINMVKHNYFYVIFLCLLGLTTYAQKVSNITYRQEKSSIIVSYDLETKTPCEVNLFVSTNAGTNWQGPLKKVMGDVGDKIASGNHSISWNVLEEFEELRGDKIQFQVRADGNNIKIVKISSQKWTTKNLDVSKYRNGDVIPEVKDPRQWASLTTGAWCYYNNDPKNAAVYGKLYNWYAVNDARGLAPEGFHIPTDAELNRVSDLKDPAGFAGLLGGYRNYLGPFNFIDYIGHWWSSSEFDTTHVSGRYLNYNNGVAYGFSTNKTSGLSVRCLKD
jgi:hypothetical protein